MLCGDIERISICFSFTGAVTHSRILETLKGERGGETREREMDGPSFLSCARLERHSIQCEC